MTTTSLWNYIYEARNEDTPEHASKSDKTIKTFKILKMQDNGSWTVPHLGMQIAIIPCPQCTWTVKVVHKILKRYACMMFIAHVTLEENNDFDRVLN